MHRKLYKSATDRAICGVCGGIAEYFNVDVVIVRLLAVILGFISVGSLLIAYIIAAVVIPDRPFAAGGPNGSARRNVYETTYEYRTDDGTVYENTASGANGQGGASWNDGQAAGGQGGASWNDGQAAGGQGGASWNDGQAGGGQSYQEQPASGKEKPSRNGWLLGLVLITAGAWWLMCIFVPFLDMRIFGAILLILLGVFVLVRK